jgi:hypothetical protein
MKRGWVIAAAIVCGVILAVPATVFFTYRSLYNPSYQGKRLYAWAEQAIHDPDPAARTKAAETLVAAFKEMRQGEPRIQLVMRFCYARRNKQGEPELTKEVLPFLIEALHAHEIMAPNSYQAIALSQVEGTEAVPALVEVLLNDEDSHARAGAVAALGMMKTRAKAAEPFLKRAASEGDGEARRWAQDALQEIERATSRDEK